MLCPLSHWFQLECTGRLRKSPVCMVSVQFSSELQLLSEVLPDKNSCPLLSTFYVPGIVLNALQALFYLILMITLLVWYSYCFSSHKRWVPNPSWSSRKAHELPFKLLSKWRSYILRFQFWHFSNNLKLYQVLNHFLMFECTIRPEHMACNCGYWTEIEIEIDRERNRKRGESGRGDKERQKIYDREKNT